MEQLINPIEILLEIKDDIKQIYKRQDDIKQIYKRQDDIYKLLGRKIKANDFDVVTLKKAAKKTNCTVGALRSAIQKGILKKDIDYRHNGARKYIFSTSSLENLKGKL